MSLFDPAVPGGRLPPRLNPLAAEEGASVSSAALTVPDELGTMLLALLRVRHARSRLPLDSIDRTGYCGVNVGVRRSRDGPCSSRCQSRSPRRAPGFANYSRPWNDHGSSY